MGSDLGNLLPGIKVFGAVYRTVFVAYSNFYISKLAAVSRSPNTPFMQEILLEDMA